MELPQCNSFRRLLYYRVGQRFGLSHTNTDQMYTQVRMIGFA